MLHLSPRCWQLQLTGPRVCTNITPRLNQEAQPAITSYASWPCWVVCHILGGLHVAPGDLPQYVVFELLPHLNRLVPPGIQLEAYLG